MMKNKVTLASIIAVVGVTASLAVVGVTPSLAVGSELVQDTTPDAVTLTDDVRFHFTETVASQPSDAIGHEGHQFVYILSPDAGAIYDGSMTYTANKLVQIAVLHELGSTDSKGQPIWTVGNTTYGWTLVKPEVSAGSFEFTGAALGLHTGGDEFIATVSVDGLKYEKQVSLPTTPEYTTESDSETTD